MTISTTTRAAVSKVAWPTNTSTPPPGWDRLTDSDGSQPSGWFTTSRQGVRAVVKGYPSWDDAPWDIPAFAHRHDEDDDYAVLQWAFDLAYAAYLFPDVDTAAGPSTHSFGNLDFCGGWQHPIAAMPGGVPHGEALLARVLSGAKPTGLLVGTDAEAEEWATAALDAGLKALVWRDLATKVWIAPTRLDDRADARALRAAWMDVADRHPNPARANRLIHAFDRGLERAFTLDLQQQPVERGAVMVPPWWDEHSDEGFIALGAVLGYPPASTYARRLGH